MCQCFLQNYAGLLACRFFLGLCEGGLFPGFVLYLSDFYRRHELQTRIGLIYGAASVSGAFSGLLAAAIHSLNGKANLKGWQWIFLIEGLTTVVFALFAMLILPNTPRQVLSFTAEEAEYCTQRLNADTKIYETSKITLKAIVSAFKEPHVLNMSVIAFCNGVVIGGLAYFTPSVVLALGYGPTKTQLMSVPPFAIALFLTLAAAQFADRYHRRGLAALATLSLAIVGCAIDLTCTSVHARYAAVCLNVASIYSTAPSILTWIPNNSAPYGKRATSVAIGFVTSNGAGIIAAWIYPTSTAPRYLFAVKFNLSLICIEMALLVVQILLLVRLNKKKISNREQLLAKVEHLSMHDQMQTLGDRHPDFKYTL
jgi:MFS family permease